MKKLKNNHGDSGVWIAVIYAVIIGLLAFIFSVRPVEGEKPIDIKSDFNGGLDRTINVYTANGGLDRTINVYTANGDLLASYTGKIDLEATEGGYVKFDFEGKHYIYYNCFVESIAVIK